jgi:hypothetical protein
MRKVFLTLLILAMISPCFAKYSGGSGDLNDPYQIANVADLLTLSADANDYNKCFIMTADIDLDPNLPGGKVFTTAVISPDTDNSNSGFQGVSFNGIFDGANYTIANLTIDTNGSGKDYLGLFGNVVGSELKNLSLENVSITNGKVCLGGLVGYNYGNISNCHLKGIVIGVGFSSFIGGMTGYNFAGTISNCSTTSIVQGQRYYAAGGLVGLNFSGKIYSCFSTGDVYGDSTAGGLVGKTCTGTTVKNSYSTSNVNGTGTLGGLIGYNEGIINSCFSTGTVSGSSSRLGGLVGENSGTISVCYSKSSVFSSLSTIGLWDVGGLVGYNYGNINNCYSKGTVNSLCYSYHTGGLVGRNEYGNISNSYSAGTVIGCVYVGGLVGDSMFGSINSSYFLNTSGPDYGGGDPLTDEQMKQQSSFVGWDFNEIWHICETTNYPKLIWQIPSGDIVCPDGVDIADLAELCGQWLIEEIPADLAPPGGDETVDFEDFAVFANQWGITNGFNELLDFTGQWLKTGLSKCSADISPLSNGDGQVNADDFGLMANNWHKGF